MPNNASTRRQEVLGETTGIGLRLIVAHDPQWRRRPAPNAMQLIAELERKAAEWTVKLDDQDGGKRKRGRKLSDGGARARFYHEVCEAHLARIVKVDLKSELFTYTIDEHALTHARLMDGKLLLVTNTKDLAPDEVVKRYKSLADIERGFRVLKSEIEIGPVYHRLPDRIRAHAAICFMALILYRVMRTRCTPARPRFHRNGRWPICAASSITASRWTAANTITGVSTINDEQSNIFAALMIKKPTLNTQLTLL